jgi:Cupin domain
VTLDGPQLGGGRIVGRGFPITGQRADTARAGYDDGRENGGDRVDEPYRVIEGKLEVLGGDPVFTAKAGSVFRIPRGTLHAWRSATAEPAVTLLFICPAGFEGFFEEAVVLGKAPSFRSSPPTPEQVRKMVELERKYDTKYPPVPGW